MKKTVLLKLMLIFTVVFLTGCQESIETKYKNAQALMAEGKYAEAAERFESLGSYEESSMLTIYCKAAAAGERGDYDTAFNGFRGLGEYKDSRMMLDYYSARSYEDGNWRSKLKAAAMYEQNSLFRDSASRAENCRRAVYDEAQRLKSTGDYDGACDRLDALGRYQSAASQIPEIRYQQGVAKREAGDWDGAVAAFAKAGSYSDAAVQIDATRYAQAESLEAAGRQDEASRIFAGLGNYSDSFERAYRPYYLEGVAKREAKDWDGAVAAFEQAGSYSDAATQILVTRYAEGEVKRTAKDWDGAVAAFEKAGNYSDAATQITETRYLKAKDLTSKGDYAGAAAIFIGIKGYKDVDSLLANDHNLSAAAAAATAAAAAARDAKYSVGNYVTFGHYPQTSGGNDNTPIEWLVLARDGNKALLISRYGLDAKPYNEKWVDITWEKCTLRTWLNGTFLNKAFTAAEQKGILLTNVDNGSSQGYSGYSTNGGNNTQDRVFLLSYAEANKYLGVTDDDGKNTKSRVAPTAYANKQGAYTYSSTKTADGAAAGWWWLRSPGYIQYYAAFVTTAGSLRSYYVYEDDAVVRPALWINLESDIF